MKFTQINDSKTEGRLLMAALAIITTESRTTETPDQVMESISKLSNDMYKDIPLKTYGVDLISDERLKQIKKHGFTGEHHANHPEWYDKSQLVSAAQTLSIKELNFNYIVPSGWDKDWFGDLCARDYEKRLVIAGALIAAEIDRLQNMDLITVKKNLPETYILTTGESIGTHGTSQWIRCVSSTGIQKDGADDNKEWEKFFEFLKNWFGDRFIEVYHNTCTWHVDFVIYYRKSE